MRRLFSFTPLILKGFLLAGCATATAQNENDPIENVNRDLFAISLAVDTVVTKPVATAYRDVVPIEVRGILRNFLNNLSSPSIFANDLLQGSPDRAGTTLVRAIVNTTFGIGGFFDVAEGWGYPRHSEDFGQTLAVWGVGEGPYLMLPLLGPSNPRDLVGRGVDFFLDPLSYVQWGDEAYVPYVRTGVDVIDFRARNIYTLNDIDRTSADFYAATRSLYRQSRNNEINNGVSSAQDLEDLPDF
jgi:phospholipid-binding lipoprotein MlaA